MFWSLMVATAAVVAAFVQATSRLGSKQQIAIQATIDLLESGACELTDLHRQQTENLDQIEFRTTRIAIHLETFQHGGGRGGLDQVG